jgi:transposase
MSPLQSGRVGIHERLSVKREAMLRFVTALLMPIDNNLAYSDVRVPKLEQKVSGCFRSDQGGWTRM